MAAEQVDGFVDPLLEGRNGGQQVVQATGEVEIMAGKQLPGQVVLAFEMAVDGAFCDAGGIGDVLGCGRMDAFARGLKIAHAIREDGRLADFVQARYSSFDQDIGAKVEAGEVGFEELESYTLAQGEPALASGRQEMLENLINEFI